ncbi:formate C-acetyltransferase/glycerol dehydratase family glycyl radical enzyme [Agathobaculum sp.]|uniref:glycyl radical protein n=1 Tax=Agathobaculum sp. TaxID=2048138 RepID=UPI00307B5A26
METMHLDVEEVLHPLDAGYQRCQRLRERVIGIRPYLCTERALLATKAYQATESEPYIIRRAKVLAHILQNMSIYILDDELIVGHQATRQRGGNLFPEFAVEWIAQEFDRFAVRDGDRFITMPEDRAVFFEQIYPYWKGRTLQDHLLPLLPEQTARSRFDAMIYAVGHHETGGFGHVVIDHERILKKGYAGIRCEVEQALQTLPLHAPDAWKKKLFYDACLIICDAVIVFANRYATLADEMAEREAEPVRRQELRQIAENCRRVPEHPAQNFWQACQVVWFNQLILQIHDNGTSYTPGRLDQFMYPYYEADLRRGVPKAALQEQLETLWIKFTEPVKLFCEADAVINVGQPTGQNVQAGGIDRTGADATNDLSYRMLEAHIHLRLLQPNFTVRLHRSTPEPFLRRTVQAIKTGTGMPQLTTDETFVQAMMQQGVSLTDARDYVPVGCMETMPKNTWGRANGGFFNLAKALELALSDGVCQITGKQVGLKTGDARQFTSMDDVKRAYETQVAYGVRQAVIENNLIDLIHETLCPLPLVSMFLDPCVQTGTDVTSGGAKYNWTALLGIGVANVGDALTGIEQMVFQENRVTMAELVDALHSNYKGNEPLRQYLIHRVPKYGNDCEEADAWVRYATDVFFDALQGHKTYHGGNFVGSLISISAYVPFGEKTGATPDGRLSGSILSDSISPAVGCDQNGPTAAMRSAVKIDQTRCTNGLIFNLRLNPGQVQSEAGEQRFAALLRSYVALGGAQVQFNLISSDTLRKAKADPEQYRGLVVRVAGYSAFFNELAEEIQDSIIARTAHML